MIWNALTIAVREIGRNLTRAFLTVLGIFIGVAAIITMVTLGQGATLAVKAQISNLGNNLLTLRPGAGFGFRSAASGVPNFTEKDAEIVGEQIAGIAAIAPVRTASLSTIYLNNARSTSVTGTTPVWRDITFSNITATAQYGRRAGLIWGLPEMAVTNVRLQRVNITADKPFGIYEAQNVRLVDCQIVTPDGVNQLSCTNAGVTLTPP